MRASFFACVLAIFIASSAHGESEHARWPIKTTVPEPVAKPASVSFEDLAAFPLPPNPHKSSANGDSTYQAKRYPPFANPLGLHEGSVVSVKGFLHLVAAESDGDYHIQISASASDGNNCVIVEVPNEDQGSDELKPHFAAVRQFIRDRLLKGKEPSASGSVMKHALYVEVAGQLFLDDWHLKDPPRGKKGMKASTLWELHPVVGIRFAPPASK